jgi:hypothetical protein
MVQYRTWAALIAATLLAGCTSFSTLHTARSVPPDERHVTVASGVTGTLDPDAESVRAVPTVAEAELRQGLSESLDLGLRAYLVGLMVDVNWMYLDRPRFAASINPSVSGFASIDEADTSGSGGTGTSTGTVWGSLWLNMLFDIGGGRTVTATTGPKAGFLFAADNRGVADDNPATTGAAATALGGVFALRFRLSERFALAPEASLYWISEQRPIFSSSVALTFRNPAF